MTSLSDAVGIAAAALVAAVLCLLGIGLAVARLIGSQWRRRTAGLRLLGQPDRSHKFGVAPVADGGGGGGGVDAAGDSAGAGARREEDSQRPEAVELTVEATSAGVGGTYGDSAEAASSGGGANNEVEDEFDEVEAGRGEEEAGGEDEEEQGAGNTPAAGLPKGTKSGKMRRAREANTAARRARVSTVGMGREGSSIGTP